MNLSRDEPTQPNYKNQNLKILKLIKNKKYPLHATKKSKMMLPKLKIQSPRPLYYDSKILNMHDQIDLKLQHYVNEDYTQHYSTSFQKQRKHVSQDQNFTYSHQKPAILCHTELPQVQTIINQYKRKPLPPQTKPNKPNSSQRISRYQIQLSHKLSHSGQISQATENLNLKKEFFLKNIRQTITNSKRIFMNKLIHQRVNLHQKNISFQYAVDKLKNGDNFQQELEKQSAYQDISPNNISHYLQFFKEGQRSYDNLKENKEPAGRCHKQVHASNKKVISFQIDDQMCVENDRCIKRPARKNPTIAYYIYNNEQFKTNNQLNLQQSKMRKQNNHKKLIQINKKSFKSLNMV